MSSFMPIVLSAVVGGASAAAAAWFTTGSATATIAAGLAAAAGVAVAGTPVHGRCKASLERFARAVEDAAESGDPRAANLSNTGVPPHLESAVRDALETMADTVTSAKAQIHQFELRRKIAETEAQHTFAVLDSLQDAILVTDGFNDLKLANAPAAEMMNLSPADARNKSVNDVITDPRIRSMITDALANSSPTHRRRVEHAIDNPISHEPQYFDVTLACLPDQRSDRVGGVVTIIRDITREREISQMKSDFVSKASHELRTPLSSINGYIELLIDGEAADEKSRQEFYTVIKSESDRLGRLIDNMLNISRIESGIVRPTLEEVDFNHVAKSAVEIIQPQAKLKDIDVHIQHGPLACTAIADHDMVKQVFLNLLSNAVKYTPEGGRVTVTIENDDSTGSVLSTIADTGLGIPPDDLDKVFDKFYRIDNYKRVAKGTGLGLSLVKQIVETVHHGNVTVSSTLGMGSKFAFTIPYEAEGA